MNLGKNRKANQYFRRIPGVNFSALLARIKADSAACIPGHSLLFYSRNVRYMKALSGFHPNAWRTKR